METIYPFTVLIVVQPHVFVKIQIVHIKLNFIKFKLYLNRTIKNIYFLKTVIQYATLFVKQWKGETNIYTHMYAYFQRETEE